MITYVVAIILVALVFDFINGFHDSANSIATIVSTRVLSPRWAVVWAAFFNFVAAFGFGTAVAKTMGKGLIDVHFIDPTVILGGLLAAARRARIPVPRLSLIAAALKRLDKKR